MRRKTWIILSAVIMALIFVQSSLPAEVSGSESGALVSVIRGIWDAEPYTITVVVRKCAHFIEFMLLGISLSFAVDPHHGAAGKRLLIWAACTAYAVTDELHQILVPGRSCEATDVLIDSAGAFFGILIAAMISRARIRKEKQDENGKKADFAGSGRNSAQQ